MKVLILFNKISENSTDDELDVLEQVNVVSNSLIELGHSVRQLEFDLNIQSVVDEIKRLNPDMIFNLAETIYNKGEFAYLAPSVLSYIVS